MKQLPTTNELGFYEIRLESIGGLGANLAGKMLAESGVLGLGLNGCNFSSYGSEKKGSPVKAFVRFAEATTEIRDHSPIEHPHVIAIFHEALYTMTNVVEGLQENGIVIVNTTRRAADVRKDLGLTHGKIVTIDALSIAVEEKSRVNTAMLGALFRICDFLDADMMRNVIRKTFEKKYPHLVESNIRTFDRGYAEVVFDTDDLSVSFDAVETDKERFGYKSMPIGGNILAAANSYSKNVSGSRQGYLPSFDITTCISCAQCDTACPDFCFVWEEGEDKRGRKQMFLKGIDYDYCKGCLKCVEACPTDSLQVIRETDQYAKDNQVKHEIPYLVR